MFSQEAMMSTAEIRQAEEERRRFAEIQLAGEIVRATQEAYRAGFQKAKEIAEEIVKKMSPYDSSNIPERIREMQL